MTLSGEAAPELFPRLIVRCLFAPPKCVNSDMLREMCDDVLLGFTKEQVTVWTVLDDLAGQ
jgi:hypothetical protein